MSILLGPNNDYYISAMKKKIKNLQLNILINTFLSIQYKYDNLTYEKIFPKIIEMNGFHYHEDNIFEETLNTYSGSNILETLLDTYEQVETATYKIFLKTQEINKYVIHPDIKKLFNETKIQTIKATCDNFWPDRNIEDMDLVNDILYKISKTLGVNTEKIYIDDLNLSKIVIMDLFTKYIRFEKNIRFERNIMSYTILNKNCNISLQITTDIDNHLMFKDNVLYLSHLTIRMIIMQNSRLAKGLKLDIIIKEIIKTYYCLICDYNDFDWAKKSGFIPEIFNNVYEFKALTSNVENIEFKIYSRKVNELNKITNLRNEAYTEKLLSEYIPRKPNIVIKILPIFISLISMIISIISIIISTVFKK